MSNSTSVSDNRKETRMKVTAMSSGAIVAIVFCLILAVLFWPFAVLFGIIALVIFVAQFLGNKFNSAS